ncbi:uncharacterized protein E0L32_005778 [Thyridium curvatum]|uniref:Uncharacterized protein n=1 Tax=Thyridium curvatum TaxID=1093900 RepID=A0A507B556_9PEZI|nr:uncharacterized protein E0L32_005778 [Thyridium curvatum]TPX13834.1 hypothetical protein E0L32_005778 [Thyridium curvatum]
MDANMPNASNIESESDFANVRQMQTTPPSSRVQDANCAGSGSHDPPIALAESPRAAAAAVGTNNSNRNTAPGVLAPQPAHRKPIQTDLHAPEASTQPAPRYLNIGNLPLPTANNGHSRPGSALPAAAPVPHAPVAPMDNTSLSSGGGARVADLQPAQTGPGTVSTPGNAPPTPPQQAVLPPLKPMESVDKISDNLSELRVRFRDADQLFSKVVGRARTQSAVVGNITALHQLHSDRHTEPDMSQNTNALNELIAKVDALATGLTTLKDTVLERDNPTTKVDSLITSSTALGDRVKRLEKRDQLTELRSLAANLSTLTDRVKYLEKHDQTSKVGELALDIATLINRVNELENPIFPSAELQQELVALQSNTDAVVKPGGPMQKVLVILAQFQRTIDAALGVLDGQAANNQDLEEEASALDRIQQAAAAAEEPMFVEDSPDEPNPRKRKRKRSSSSPPPQVRSRSDALPVLTPQRLSRSQTRPASPAIQNGNAAQARVTPDSDGPIDAAGNGAVPGQGPAAAPSPASLVGDELVAFLIEMDCTRENDLKKLQKHLARLREFLLYEGDIIPGMVLGGRASGRGSLVLRIGGLAGADARPAPRESLQEYRKEKRQPDEHRKKAIRLGVVELYQRRKDQAAELLQGCEDPAAKLPKYAVYIGQVFQTYTIERSGCTKTETTGYEVFMDVTNPRKALWAVYRLHERFLGEDAAMFFTPVVPFYKGFERRKQWDSFQLLNSVSDWQKPREQAMYEEGRGADLLKSTTMICKPEILVAHYNESFIAIREGWSESKALNKG